MGMLRKGHVMSDSDSVSEYKINFSNFKIIKSCKVGKIYVSKIKYTDFDNFEGVKIIMSLTKPVPHANYDPHFLETNDVLMRFRPEKGMFNMAIKIAEFIQEPI